MRATLAALKLGARAASIGMVHKCRAMADTAIAAGTDDVLKVGKDLMKAARSAQGAARAAIIEEARRCLNAALKHGTTRVAAAQQLVELEKL